MEKLISIAPLLFILVLQTVSMVYAWEIERPACDINVKERKIEDERLGASSFYARTVESCLNFLCLFL